MKALLIALCVAGLLLLAGCSDGDGNVNVGANNGNNGNNGGGGNADNLQTFVTNNCKVTPSGDAVALNGRSFPPNDTTDPAQSVFTRNCLTGVN